MSFIRKIKTNSGMYRARVENKRVDGKVRQTVVQWLGKTVDTEEILFDRIGKLEAQPDILHFA
jgi:hypothetical protein